MLLGAALALGASWLLSASTPQIQVYGSRSPSTQMSGNLKVGDVLFSVNMAQGSGAGLPNWTDQTAVTISRLEGGWALIEYPELPSGGTWINTGLLVSYSARR